MALARTLQEIASLQHRQLAGIVGGRGVGRMSRIYAIAQSQLLDRLEDLRRRGMGQSFTATQLQAIHDQAHWAVRSIQHQMAGHLAVVGPEASSLATVHMHSSMERLTSAFRQSTPWIPTFEIATFQNLLPQVDASLLSRYQSSVQTYGPPVIKRIQDKLSVALVKNSTVDEAVDAVAGEKGVFAGERWRAERIVRTEMSYSYGVAKQASMEKVSHRVQRMKKRLVATFDNRTGKDSIELNGQVKDVHQPFVWVVKNSKGQPTGKVVHYMQPPNRPNDREISIPWMEGWPAGDLETPESYASETE